MLSDVTTTRNTYLNSRSTPKMEQGEAVLQYPEQRYFQSQRHRNLPEIEITLHLKKGWPPYWESIVSEIWFLVEKDPL